jgi:hypothetical protein
MRNWRDIRSGRTFLTNRSQLTSGLKQRRDKERTRRKRQKNVFV